MERLGNSLVVFWTHLMIALGGFEYIFKQSQRLSVRFLPLRASSQFSALAIE